MKLPRMLCLVALGGLLAGCGSQPPPPAPARPVRAVVIHHVAAGESVSLTGQIQAQNQINLAFRIGGRLIERKVSVGDRVTRGQLVARLEAQDAKNSLRTAEAELAAAQAAQVQARNNELRYRSLAGTGVESRSAYEDTQEQLAATDSRVKSAAAGLASARDNLGYTELHADAAGTITVKSAEPGEVVAAGQAILQEAVQGGIDAVFNVPAQLIRAAPKDPLIAVVLSDDPTITATGHVREVSPAADPVTGTYTVKVALDSPPATMRLGATVIGSMKLASEPLISIPGTALTLSGTKPAVWVVDPAAHTVALRAVAVARYEPSEVVIAGGLADGAVVVTAGVHALRPGQQVRLLGNAQ